jgi:hypothetical protein
MLRDRRVLLEHELDQVKAKAAAMYLDIVRNNADVHSAEYQALREQVTRLQLDLDLVNHMIHQGQP